MNISIQQKENCVCFCHLFQHLKAFSTNVNIMFEESRMYIQTMDSARISIIEAVLPAAWFQTYELETPVSIGVNTNILFKILNSREPSQNISIQLDSENNDKLFIHFHSDNKAVFDKFFEIPLIEIDSEMMQIPEYESNADLTLCSTNFANIIGQLKMFGDNLNIKCNEESLVLSSSSEESGKMNVNIQIDDLNSFAINDGQELNLAFSLTFLGNICLYYKIAKEIEIQLTEGFPLRARYYLGSGNEPVDSSAESATSATLATLTFYLAPKIDDDE